MSLFAQFSADKVYTISNRNDANVYMQDNGTGRVQLGGKNDNSYWKLIPTANANCYYVQNAVTEKYMQSTKTANTQVNTGDNPVEICVLDCSAGEGAGMYGMASTDQGTVNFTSGTVGCNWHGDGYVQGFAAASGTNHRSFWKIVEAEMPQPPVPVTPTGWTAPPAPGQNLTSLSSSTYVYAYNIQAEAVLTRGYNWGTKAIADQLENGDAAEGAGRQPITVIPDGNYTIKMHIKDRSADVFVGQANNSDASAAVWSDQGNAGNRVRFTYAESPNYPNAYVLTNLEKNKVLDVMFLRGGPLTLFGGKGYTDWAFVTIDDVKAGKLRQFKARKAMWELYKAVEKAGALDANADALNTALATYTNSDATADDLRAAFRTMFIAVASSIEDPVDASYLFDHPDMAADKSLGNWNWQCDQDAAYGAGEYERWHAVFNAHQTQTVPNGLYDVRFMGIYRLDGGSSTPPLLTATTSETYAANFPNMNDLGGYWNVTNGTDWTNAAVNQRPNQMWTASDALALDQASALIENTKVRNGSLDIRFEVTGGEQWFNWHRVIVTYKGAVNMGLYKTLVAKIAEAEGYVTAKTGVIVQSYLDAINTVIDDVDDLTANSEEEDLTNAIASLNTAISNADAAPTVVNYNFLNETIILCEAEGVPSDDVNAAKNVRDNSTTNTAFTDALNALRIARRIHHAEKDTHSWAGNEPAAGDFYLYNVGQQRFFCGGDDWGAHAALGFPGISVTLESADGAYKINTHLANGKDGDNTKEYLNHNGYCDTWTSDSWQFVEQSGGVYTIARSGDTNLLLGYSTNTYNRLDTDKSDASNPNNQWKLVTKADRDALLATATEDAPQDASYLIKSPGFSQREDVSAWALSGDASIWARGANHPDFAVEAYDKTAAGVEQTVTGLPAGTYKLMVQAFYRDGNFNTQAETLANGGEARQLATLYAGTKSALIQNVSGGADKAPGMGRSSSVGYMPDGIDDACLYFQSGLYWASLDEIVVGQDGTMTIGARKTEKINDGDWMVLDNFRLIYKGAGVDLSGVKADLLAKIGEANTIMTELGLTLSYLNTLAVNGQNVYDNSTEADEIVDATNALQAAINVTQNTTDLTYFKQTVALATGEGVATSAAKAAVEAVNNSENIASVVSAQLYNLRAARKVKALGKPDVYTGSTPAAGKVYLYNIGTGLFLGMGSDWSTHAAVDQVGIEVELVASGEGFQMKSAHGNFNGGAHGPYVDTDGTEVYTFTAVSGNVYNIKQGDLFLGWNPNADTDGLHYWNTIGNTADADGADANFQWKVITASEREALLATAAADNAVDVSYMIKNPSLNRKPDYDMWSKECDGGNGGARVSTQDNNNGNRAADFGYEYYEPNSFAFTQKVEGLKPGNYRVTVQGFYRDGNGDHQKGIVESDGISANAAYLVAKDQQAWLPNISSVKDFVPGQDGLIETTKGSYPNWPRAAIEYFENGAYLTTVDAMVGANGELTIGVKKDTRPNAGDWVVLDNFRLYYLGAPYGINTMSIVGDFTGGWPNGDDWSMAKHMVQDAENPNIWTYIIEDFKAETGTYDYKVTANEQWGVYEKPSEFDPKNERGNAEFTFGTEGYPAGHYRLVFTVNTSTHTLTLDVQKPTVTISENADYVASATEDALILLNREFKNEETWNTFVVPFAINTTDLKRAFGENVEVAVYSENSDNPNNVTISFTTMDEPAVSANVPVLLKTDVTATEFLFKSDIVEDTPKVVGNNFDFVGSYAANKVIDEGDYYLSQNTLFKSAGIGSYVKGTRAYLHAKDVVEGRIVNLFIDGEEQTTGISTMQNSPSTMHNEVYNLNGQKMEKQSLRKGLYIVNGKKVVK
jgi:hypothetical protein